MRTFIQITLTIIIYLSGSCYAESLSASTMHIRFAVVGPFSGAYSAYGALVLSGAMQAANDINAAGGIKGINIEIVPFDDQCNPDLAIKQAEAIINAQTYHAVIGHVCSAATLAASNIYARANTLVITPTATNDKITARNISTIFRMSGTDQQQSSVAASFIARKLKSKRVAVLHDQDLYSKDLADAVSEKLLQFESTPILYQGVPRGTRNFTNIIKKIKVLHADAIYFAGLYPEVAALAKTLNVLQLQIPLISADGAAINKFISTVGGAAQANSILLTFGDNPKDLISSKTIIQKMHKNHLETTGYALYAYATVQALSRAIDSANTTDNVTLANWLHQHEVDTVLGKKSWDTCGNIMSSKFNVYTINGENNLTVVPIATNN